MNDESSNLQLSKAASRTLAWETIADALRISLNQLGGDRGRASTIDIAASPEITPEQRQMIERAFEVAQQEFRRVLDHQRKVMKFVTVVLLGSIALAVAGATILRVTPWGSALSIASLTALLGLLLKAWRLTRDQAMLELIPARYQLAMQIAASRRQAEQVLNSFLKETSSLQARR